MKRITIKDIAKALNMHHSTVSRALRDEKSIHSETRTKVLAYARENGYQLNRNALHLRGDASNVIGVVVPNIHHSFFSNYVSIVTNLAFAQGYVVSVFQSNESVAQERQIAKALIQQNVAGVMASVSMETVDVQHFEQLKKFRIPLVLFDRISQKLEVPSVVLNNAEIVEEAFGRLFEKGFRRIAYLSGTPVTNVFHDRQQGYRNAVSKLTPGFEKCVALTEGFTVENGKAAFDTLMKESVRPDALICDSHILMLAVLMKLKEASLVPGSEFGLAAFGGNNDVSMLYPGIISIRQPEEAMAGEAFELLMKAMNGADEKPEIKIFKAAIFEINSTHSK